MSIRQYSTKTAGKLWRFDIKVKGKVHTRRGFENRQAALKAEVELRDELERGLNPRNQYQTLETYLHYWSTHLDEFRDEHTPQHAQQLRIKNHVRNIVAVIGSIKIKDLKKSHILKLRDFYAEKHAPRTRRQMELILKAALNDGVAESYLPFNPVAQVKAPKVPKHLIKDRQALQPEQQQKALEAAKEYSDQLNDPRWYMMVLALLETGMRKGELCALQWKHIDLDKMSISVSQSIDWSYGERKGRIKETKTEAGLRSLYIDEHFAAQIKSYMTWVKEKRLQLGKRLSGEDFFLFADDFGFLNKTVPQRRWETIAKRAGLSGVGLHTLRHSNASIMIHMNVNPKIISKQLGHTKMATTFDIYGTQFDKLAAEQVRKAKRDWRLSNAGRDNLS